MSRRKVHMVRWSRKVSRRKVHMVRWSTKVSRRKVPRGLIE